MDDFGTALLALFGTRLKEHEPLSKHTNFRVGGPARWFVDIQTEEELVRAVELIQVHNVRWFVLGGGSNTLALDEGFDGIVLCMAMRAFRIEGTSVVAEAGVISVALARATAEAGLAGFEWAISLPGTVGGAVRGNAGCFGGEVKDACVSVRVLRHGQGSSFAEASEDKPMTPPEIVKLTREDLQFGYRESSIKHSTDIVVSATFELQRGDVATLKAKLGTILAKRKATQPLSSGSAGCTFKNYEAVDETELQRIGKKLDILLPGEMMSSRRVSAGWLIDKLGLKGTKIGGAQISSEHGNFILNNENATASDIVQLIALVKTRARNEAGIQLQEEVQILA